MKLLNYLFLLASLISLACHFIFTPEAVFEGALSPAKQLLWFFIFCYAMNLYCVYKIRSAVGVKKQKELFSDMTVFVASALSLYIFIQTVYYFIVHQLNGIEGYLVLPFLFFCVSSIGYIKGIIKSVSSIVSRKMLPLSNDDLLKTIEEKRKKQYIQVSGFGIKPEQECLMCLEFDVGMCSKRLGEMVVSKETGYENWKKQKKFVMEGISPEFIPLSDTENLVAEQVSLLTFLMIARSSLKEVSNLGLDMYYKALFMVVASYCKNTDGVILSSFGIDNIDRLPVNTFTFELSRYKEQLEYIRSGIIKVRGNYGIDDKLMNQMVLFIQNFFALDEENQKHIMKSCFSKIMNNEINKQVAIPEI